MSYEDDQPSNKISHIQVKAPIFDLIRQIETAFPNCGYVAIDPSFRRHTNGRKELVWELYIEHPKTCNFFDSFEKLSNFIQLLIATSTLPPTITVKERTRIDCFKRMDGDFKNELN